MGSIRTRKRGSRRWGCFSCEETFFVRKYEHNSRFRLRCPACGSIAVGPHSDGAVDQALDRNSAISASDEIERPGVAVYDLNYNKKRVR